MTHRRCLVGWSLLRRSLDLRHGARGDGGAGSSNAGKSKCMEAEAVPVGPTNIAPASTPALTRPMVNARPSCIDRNVAISPE